MLSLDSINEVLDKLLNEFQSQLLQDSLKKEGILLSSRQEKFIQFIERKDNNLTTIDDYKKRFKVSYETARKDLSELEQLGLFKKIKKVRKTFLSFMA